VERGMCMYSTVWHVCRVWHNPGRCVCVRWCVGEQQSVVGREGMEGMCAAVMEMCGRGRGGMVK